MSNSQNLTNDIAASVDTGEAGTAPEGAVDSGSSPVPVNAGNAVQADQEGGAKDVPPSAPPGDEKPRVKKGSKKSKAVESLADFIASAYARKGQRVSLKPKTQKLISKNPRLDSSEFEHLSELAHGDITLAVARQLILAALEITNPVLKGSLREFVGSVLRAHPAFASDELRAALNNLPDGPDVDEALSAVARADYSKNLGLPEKMRRKKPNLVALRSNATYCLALWLAETRGISAEELAGHLFDSLWRPDPKAAQNDTARLRLLTEIRDPQAVGTACETFKTHADQMWRAAESARRGEAAALENVRTLTSLVEQLKREVQSKEVQIGTIERAIEEQRQQCEVSLSHLRDDFEKLRSRVLRRIREDVSLLDEGLHALRRDPPRVHVMDDHAERAVARLRSEIKELEA
jgi:hypothetical protein